MISSHAIVAIALIWLFLAATVLLFNYGAYRK